jgi:hypothetical protein
VDFGLLHSGSNQPLLHASPDYRGFSLALDDIAKLVDAGKKRGYLTYNEVK